jgi:soluble lytic murein transglycosylase-like protein
MDNIFYLLWYCNQYLGFPDGLLARIAYQEQGGTWNFNLNAHSGRGAAGLMQLMPAAVAQIGQLTRFAINPMNPIHAVFGAGVYLKWLYSHFGNWRVALAAYNWGYGNVHKMIAAYGGLREDLLPGETRKYLTIADDLGL